MSELKDVLIIDDKSDIVETLQELIDLDYADNDPAMSAEAAFELLDINQYHCIILDLNLAGTNGVVVINQIQESFLSKNKKTPVIILSIFVNQEFISKFNDKFFAILSKPFNSKLLLDLLKGAYRKWDKNHSIDYVAKEISIPDLKKIVANLLDKSKNLKKFDKYFKNLNLKHNQDNYFNKHAKLVIDISISVINELHWGGEEAKEKIIYSVLLQNITLEESLIKITDLEEINKHSDKTHIIGHPKRVSDAIQKCDRDIQEEVGKIILQHREKPDGSGYPGGLKDQEIIPMASLLIICNDMAYYLLDNNEWSVDDYLKIAREKFTGVTFIKIIKGIDDSQKSITLF